jgi:hypothetical protein
MGWLRHELLPGSDCPKGATFLQTHHMVDGELLTKNDSICIWEQPDSLPLLRHYEDLDELRLIGSVPRTSLVVRQIATVYNYDYICRWGCCVRSGRERAARAPAARRTPPNTCTAVLAHFGGRASVPNVLRTPQLPTCSVPTTAKLLHLLGRPLADPPTPPVPRPPPPLPRSYIFHMDGSIQTQVHATGYMQTAAYPTNATSRAAEAEYSTRVHENVMATLHDHFMNFKVGGRAAATEAAGGGWRPPR